MAEEIKENQTEEQQMGDPGAEEQETKESAAEETSSGTEEDIMAQWEAALKEAGAEGEAPAEESPAETEAPATTAVETPKLEEFREAAPQTEGPHPDLEFILDIPLEVSVEIGRTKMIINDLLKLSQGSIIELNKMAGEPVEIYVNGKLMARGEVVVVNERFGVRLTEIISPQERIKKLGE